MKVNIKDVAEKSGFSPATVSRVFNRHPNVRDEVRHKVIAAALELGFVPHSSGGKKVIAIITGSYNCIPVCGYLAMAITALTREIFSHGFSMELVPEQDVGLLHENMVCGAISLMYDDNFNSRWGRENNIPLIGVNSVGHHGDGVYAVGSNEMQGMRLAFEYLHGCGHRRIGLLISGKPDNWCNRTRLEGFKAAAQALRCLASAENYRFVGTENIYEPLGQLLQLGVTAIIATGESAGIAVAYALNIFGKRIPQDISLISHEQDNTSRYCIPRQTTLSQDFGCIGRLAGSMMEDILAGRPPLHDALVDYNLIKRDSVATLR